MRYLGGKWRIRKRLVAALPEGPCWEPFCGGGSMTHELAKTRRVWASDAQPALICMWQALQAGWVPPTEVSEADYAAARGLPDTNPLKAFVGFGCSFAGKFFEGYARCRVRNYACGSANSLSRKLATMKRVAFECRHFATSPVPPVEFVYCDPPYSNATGYSTGPFDGPAFWATCQTIVSGGTRVFVSERSLPDVATRAVTTIPLTSNIDGRAVTEYLLEVL